MASHTQTSPQQTQKRGSTGPILPPANAMSLRAREIASMSLKHIFDQHMLGNGASSRPDQERAGSNPSGQQTGGLQGTRSHSVPDLRKRDIPKLDLAFRKAQDSAFASPSTGFGSPIPTQTPTIREPELVNSLCVQQNYCTPHAASAALGRVSPPKLTAQMTIFYSGTVNVYEDVPADKANAIMVLARDMSSFNAKCPSPSTVAAAVGAPSGCTETMIRERAVLCMKTASFQPETALPVNAVHANMVGISKVSTSISATSPQAILSISSRPPSPAPVSMNDEASTLQGAGAPARRSIGTELPFARKASLARFLEKRKDRAVQVQQVGDNQQGATEEKGGGNGGENVSCSGKRDDDPAAPSSSKRPWSPSPSWQSTNNSSSRENFGRAKLSKVDDEYDDGSSLGKIMALVREK